MEDAGRLMERVRARDADAFEALYDQYHRLVYGVAFRVLSDAAAAEDVTQAVFLRIWSDPGLFRDGNFGAWVARIARNRAYDILRSRALHPQSELPETLPVEDAVDETVIANMSGERVRSALEQLPPEQREPIELGFFGGITHDQIARTTGLPLGTIKTRIRTGLRRLRAALQETVTV